MDGRGQQRRSLSSLSGVFDGMWVSFSFAWPKLACLLGLRWLGSSQFILHHHHLHFAQTRPLPTKNGLSQLALFRSSQPGHLPRPSKSLHLHIPHHEHAIPLISSSHCYATNKTSMLLPMIHQSPLDLDPKLQCSHVEPGAACNHRFPARSPKTLDASTSTHKHTLGP